MNKNALVLSGGGSRGAYEIGVWQALRQLQIPIHIVTGTSVGALNGAMVAQDEFDLSVKLWQELETHMVFDLENEHKIWKGFDFEIAGMSASEALSYAKEILLHGGAGTSGLEHILDKYVDESRIRSASIELGIVTLEFPALKTHYLFTEDIPFGKLKDYILASASCFPAVHAREIDGVRFIDGGYVDVMPVELALEKGADTIISVHLEAAGFLRKGTMEIADQRNAEMILIKSNWDLGNFLIFDTDNTRRLIRLGYLETMKAFGVYEGTKYTLEKGEFTQHERLGAEAAAEIFELEPCLVYGKELLHNRLHHAVSKTPLPDRKDIHSPIHVFKKLNKATLVLFIAENLEEKESASIFMEPGFFKIFQKEVVAANYLRSCYKPIPF